MEDTIKTIKYKTCLIQIIQDNDCDSPDRWGDDSVFLVHYHRDFTIKRDEIIKENEAAAIITNDLEGFDDGSGYFKHNVREIQKKYYTFDIDAYIHSGISLSFGGGFHGRLPEGHERFDVSSVGLILVSKKEARGYKKAKVLAQGLLDSWNNYLSGNVYGFLTKDTETEEIIDSCWGFYGDIEKSSILDEARESINGYVKNRAKSERKKYWNGVIKEAKEKIKTAKNKLNK